MARDHVMGQTVPGQMVLDQMVQGKMVPGQTSEGPDVCRARRLPGQTSAGPEGVPRWARQWPQTLECGMLDGHTKS